MNSSAFGKEEKDLEYVLEMKHISKSFPGIKANDDINFQLKKGEIHALVGENGAGKSTLMNILFGLYQPDEGEIWIKGEKRIINNPNIAIDLGIGMVHQHFMLVPPLTVAENVILGIEPKKGLSLDIKQAIKNVKDISEQYGLSIDPQAKINQLSVGMQQRVEIIKTLYRGADILILDEPTAVLTPQEIKELFKIMEQLIKQGKTIIFITHKLKEVMEISNRVTVLRRGKTIGTVETENTSEVQLAEMMVGRKVVLKVAKKPKQPGEIVLEVNNLHTFNQRGIEALKGVSLEVRAGEILGIAGVAGNGQSELIDVIVGLLPAKKGNIKLKNTDITKASIRGRRRKGIGHIPEDRHHRGLVLDYTVAENLVLGDHNIKPASDKGIINYNSIFKKADRLIAEFDIRTPSKDTFTRSLSGGNQQKVIVAREFDIEPSLLIAAQPTRGVDIGAIEFIHQRIIEQRDKGKAVLLVSSELQEIMSLSDRILVMFEGQIVGEVDPKTTSEENIGLMMAGIKRGETQNEK